MQIENNILAISNTIFKDRENYKYVTKEQKESNFFIINRYFSKIYPEMSEYLNKKNIDKESSMDCWYYFMKDKTYPKLFWSKSKIKKEKEYTKVDMELLSKELNINENDIDLLIAYHPDTIKDELKKIKNKK